MSTSPWRKCTWALAWLYLYRSLAASALTYPVALLAGGTGLSLLPSGDALAFAPGGLYALEVASHARSLSAAFSAGVVGLLVALALGLLPSWYWLSTLLPARKPARAWSEVRGTLQRFAALSALAWLIRALALGFGLAASVFALSSIGTNPDERFVDLMYWGAGLLVFAPLALSVSSVEGLAQLFLIARAQRPHGCGVATAVTAATGVVKRHPWATVGGYSLVCALSVALVAVGALLVAQVDVSQGGLWRTGLSFAVHQGVVLTVLLLRATWQWQAARWVKG